MFRKLFLFLTIFICFSRDSHASHLMGGEITWDCAGGGNYIFYMKLYRDCNGILAPGIVTIGVTGHPSLTGISLSIVSQTDISPSCNAAGPSISCPQAEAQTGWPNSSSPVAGAVQEILYQSAPITLSGIPPASGWIFTFDECCRNPGLTNLNLAASGEGFTLRAIMYPFNGQSADPCFDSSPKFLQSPGTVICMGYPFTYNHNAYDPEKDSLYYSWAQPYTHILGSAYNPPVDPAPLNYASGYSFNSPLPGTTHNAANVPASINPVTGEISFTSFTQGNFVTVVKVQAWKCGQLVAEIFREIQIVLLPCFSNNPPSVSFTAYQDTVYAGDLVNFTISASDPEFLSDGLTPQTVTLTASGNIGPSCNNPPCAGLSPSTPVSGSGSVSTDFNWLTSCDNLSSNLNCNGNLNTYTFVISAKDDFCPAPAVKIATVSITVLALPTVSSPQPNCVSVLPNGDISLTWTPSIDPAGTFDAYMIYTAASPAGPFILLDSIFSISQNIYLHSGAGGDLAPVYYSIRSRSGCNVLSPALDTVASMYLQVVNPADGTALLNWNPIASPPLSTSSSQYPVYLEYPASNWSLAGISATTNFRDTIFVCNNLLYYRVELADLSGCVSVSSLDSGTFQNIIVPSIPVIDTLSVDENNLAQMNWNPSPSPDVEAYIVYRFNGSGWVPVDTIYGINNTSYTYLLSTASAASEDYRIAAFDTCGNISPLGVIQSTIFLSAQPDICNRSAVLSWSPYGNIGSGLAGYNIFLSTTGLPGSFSQTATVSAATTTFTASSLLASTMYYFKVQAFDNSGTNSASSNYISFFSAVPMPPNFAYLRKVSVTEPNSVEISCHVDVTASTQKYKFMRSPDNSAGSFMLVGAVTAGMTNPVVFTDKKVLVDKFSYYYKVVTVDSCGFDGLETDVSRTILLSAKSNSLDLTNTLFWNDYEIWSGNVLSYAIYRGIDGVFDMTPIATVPFSASGINSYTDDVSSILQGQGVFNYYVEAFEGMGNIYGFAESSRSNMAEAYQEAMVYVPNAFNPAGVNTIFLPVTTFVDIDDYQLSVYNRWGLKVFESQDQNQGWDGTSKGNKCEGGVYVYLLRFKTSTGEYIDRKGSVTLLR